MGLYVNEQWKAVPGYEGLYEVSDHGNVKSLARTVKQRNGTRDYRVPERILTAPVGSMGYRQVALSRDRKVRQVSVHVLVLEAFVGPRPEGHHACHWDDDKTNNHLSNLRWGTLVDNAQDALRNGRNHNLNKTHCVHGHEFTPENTYWVGEWRSCLTCRKDAARRQQERRRATRG